MLEAILEPCHAEILTATSAKEAREILTKHDISLVYLDIMMPDISGYELAEEIHSMDRNRYVPIIFVTAKDHNEEETSRSYKSGVVDILQKPVQPDVIQAKTRIFLQLDEQQRLIEQQQNALQQAFAQLQDYAQHDQLTGLLNREQISSLIRRMLGKRERYKDSLAVMFLDLDHFKIINDSFGHDVGDMLLQSIASRLKKCVRDVDYVARLGGDEFCVVLTEVVPPETSSKIADRILKEMAEPHIIKDQEIFSNCSLGIALYDGTQTSESELLKNADAAMYLAKKKGRGQFAYFSEELEKEALMRIDLGNKLKHAIERDQLSLLFQPQYSSENGELVGFEALLRWFVDDQWVSPVLFISIAEEVGLINALGNWALRQATSQLKNWQDIGLVSDNVTMSVNISIRQLQEDNFVQEVEAALKDSQLDPACLELELTESVLMSDPDRYIEMFKNIHKMGTKVSVDDFGTGYSSLSYLSTVDLDTLKIDRSFVSNITEDEHNQAIVKAIIGLSHNLGLRVVAEGVETEAQKAFLRENKCDILQGYYLSKPIKASEVEALFRESA